MRNSRSSFVLALFFASALAGCDNSRTRAEREKQRLQAEEQAQREIQKSNQAVNEVSKKLGRKVPALDIGVPVPAQTTPATPPPEKKP